MDAHFITPQEHRRYYWGWGVQDNIFYKKMFNYLDQHQGRPFFITLTTISNHMKFKGTPLAQRYLYKQQNSKKQYYSNTIRVTDEYLKTFFAELKKRAYLNDAIVLILGDHSFPVGEHGSYDSEGGFYNEYFKTPLLIWSKNIKAQRIKYLRSQLDIAPTILSLLHIPGEYKFLGNDLFDKNNHLVFLVQPYAGVFLSVIDEHFHKYVLNLSTQREYFFNLIQDLQESYNIVDELSIEQRKQYRKLLQIFFLNQSYLEGQGSF